MIKRILAICLIVATFLSCSSAVIADSENGMKLVYVVDTIDEKQNIESMYFDSLTEDEKSSVNIVLAADFSSLDIVGASAVAIKYSEIPDTLIRTAYADGVTVYVYGDFTINEYKAYLGLDEYYITPSVYDYYTLEEVNKEAKTRLSDEQEANDTFNVVCSSVESDEKRFLSQIFDGDVQTPAYVYFRDVYEYEKKSNEITSSPRSNVAVDFGNEEFKTTFDGYDTSTYTSYILYQNTAEVVSNKDFFILSSVTYAETESYRITEVGVMHEAEYVEDELLDWSPDSVRNAVNVSVSVGYGMESGLSGGVAVNNLFQGEPEIVCTPDMGNGDVEWELIADDIPARDLSGQAFRCMSSWASTGTKAHIRLKVRATASIPMIYVPQPWMQYDIVYDY